jgi:ATP-binding cassette subfamily C (CFTR/MRP) protein 4
LKLSKAALGETTVGEAVNLLSNDVSRFDVLLMFLAYIWIGPVEMVMIVYLMWQQIGIATLTGVASVVLLLPLQGICNRYFIFSVMFYVLRRFPLYII